MSNEFFSMEMPDLDSFIKKLDMYDRQQNEALRTALHQVGDNMKQAQRRRISGVKAGNKLSEFITRGEVYTTKKGSLGIRSGYQAGAFKTDSEGFNPGVVGMTWEFGRPGQSPRRSGATMTQTRNGKKVTVKKGTIQPVPHIRAGFDDTVEQNVQTLISAVNAVTDKLGE
jgi:hypothetical protein